MYKKIKNKKSGRSRPPTPNPLLSLRPRVYEYIYDI